MKSSTKGFTLVELLAVLSIAAFMLLAIVPLSKSLIVIDAKGENHQSSQMNVGSATVASLTTSNNILSFIDDPS